MDENLIEEANCLSDMLRKSTYASNGLCLLHNGRAYAL